jgi:hypothetical protein
MTEMSYTVNGRNYSPGIFTEIAIHRMLFNEPNRCDCVSCRGLRRLHIPSPPYPRS